MSERENWEPRFFHIFLYRAQERSSEVASKDGRAETSDAEILQKSSVKVAPMTNAGSDIRIAQQTVVSQSPPPPPPPPNVLMPIKKTSQMRCKLPSLNWLPLRPNQVKGTIFNGLNDERLRKIINFTHFEDKFRCDILQSSTSTPLANRLRMPTYITLLEPTRLRNVAILRRKLNFDADSVIEVINDYKINQLDLDSVQILTNLAPRDSETDSYRSYLREKKDDGILSNEDKFLLKLSQVDRLTSKLCVMAFLGNFEDLADSLSIQLCAVNSTSMSLKSSKKFRSVLEIILTFGNYMNSNKSSGAAYGFRLKGAFERLSDTRSNDKKQTLMEFIVETITEKFSSLLNLDSELLCITESARISMKNVTTEIESIQSDWCQLINEIQCSKHATLKAFEAKALPKFNKLTNELDTTRSNYNECLSYFGEDSAEATDSNEFFSVICKFVSQFKVIAGKVKLWDDILLPFFDEYIFCLLRPSRHFVALFSWLNNIVYIYYFALQFWNFSKYLILYFFTLNNKLQLHMLNEALKFYLHIVRDTHLNDVELNFPNFFNLNSLNWNSQ